jgi:phytoene/squalene synthetase
LAAGDYLAAALSDYRREVRFGRVPFAIDELLAAGIDNADLAANMAPPRLQDYLDLVRRRATQYFEVAAGALPPARRSEHRHLLVLAALGKKHLNSGTSVPGRRRIADMLLAWKTARRANVNSELST